MQASDFITPLLEAVAHQQAGRFEAASAGFASVLEIEPEQPQALFLGGVLAFKAGLTAHALDLLERSVTVRPSHVESHFALGNALWAAGRKEAACQAWQDVLQHDPDHVGAWLNLARAQEAARETEAAVASCRAAVAASPQSALAHSALSSALRADSQFRASLAAAEAALAREPKLAQAHYQRGTTLKCMGWPEAAAASLREAIRLAPDDASSHLNLANVLFDQGDDAAAEHHCRTAIAADPAMAEAHAVLGYLLTQNNRLEEAIAACEVAVRLNPEMPEGHTNMGIALLSAGDLPGGFAQYEWRKKHPVFRRDFRSLPSPEWDGGPVEGRRILILAEQGLGDTVMFARYAALLHERGAEVTIACDRRLIPLLRHAPGAADVITNIKQLRAPDLWADQMSLPLLCRTTLETIPSPGRYLQADIECAAKWHARLPRRADATKRVGVIWAGNPHHSNDANRSCPIEVFRAFRDLPSTQLVSVQVGKRAGEAAELGIEDLSPLLTDYAETAGLLANLDMVLTVDTSVAHLAAAMGKPTWILLPCCADWRWLRDRTDSPWYRSARLFRQPAKGDWDAVAAAVATAFAAL